MSVRDVSQSHSVTPSLSSNQLKSMLDLKIEQIINGETGLSSIEPLSKQVPLRSLEEVIRIDYPSHVDALRTAKAMLYEARHALKFFDQTIPYTMSSRFAIAAGTLLSMVESVVFTFGVSEFFKRVENASELDMKVNRVMMLIHFSLLLVSVIGTVVGGSVISWTLFSIAGISLIYPYVRPVPVYIPKGANWTRQHQMGDLQVFAGRKKSLDEIAAALLASKTVQAHPMLIGKSGIGKTETVKALVQAIARGDYPELQGKQIFYFNTADLVQSLDLLGSENKVLSQIKEAIGRYQDQVILVFDMLHLACQEDQILFGEQLKAMLDPGSDRFPFVIGITTEEEYYRDIYINHASFARRFKRIHIDNPDPIEQEALLANTLLRQAPHLIVEQGALRSLYEKTQEAFGKECPEPMTSLRVLSRCIQKAAESQKSSLEEKVEKIRLQIQTFQETLIISSGKECLPYGQGEKIEQLENILQDLEEKLACEQREIRAFLKQREAFIETKKAMFQSVVKVAHLQPDQLNRKDQAMLVKFLLLSHFLVPMQEKAVRENADRLGVRTILDRVLIDQVIQEQLAAEIKVAELIQGGKLQLEERRGDKSVA